MVRKYNDVQAIRDMQRAEELVARQQGLIPRSDHRALRGHAESAGLSMHAATLAVLSSDPVVPRAAIPRLRQATPSDRQPDLAVPAAPVELDPLGMERLCVASRAVLARMPDLHATEGAETDRARLLEHTETLADLERVTSLSPSEVVAHAWVVRDALTAVGTDDALGIAVWFDDVLGTAGLAADPVGATA